MSALGQKQTLQSVRPMSALPSKADIGACRRGVRFVPLADSCTAAITAGICDRRNALYPRKRTSVERSDMSAVGQKRTYALRFLPRRSRGVSLANGQLISEIESGSALDMGQVLLIGTDLVLTFDD